MTITFHHTYCRADKWRAWRALSERQELLSCMNTSFSFRRIAGSPFDVKLLFIPLDVIFACRRSNTILYNLWACKTQHTASTICEQIRPKTVFNKQLNVLANKQQDNVVCKPFRNSFWIYKTQIPAALSHLFYDVLWLRIFVCHPTKRNLSLKQSGKQIFAVS